MDSVGSSQSVPEGIFSLLDTDLYKLTMQSAVLQHFPDIEVTYAFTNRTPNMKLNRIAFTWLKAQVEKLGNIKLTSEELSYLTNNCPYLKEPYLRYLETFRLQPDKQIEALFHVDNDSGSENDTGDVEFQIRGLWLDTILYEIPLLALTSEAYFKFCDCDWNHHGQVETAKEKGLKLLEADCLTSEFGTRRRRDYHTQELVLTGLCQAIEEGKVQGLPGQITGTSNVHFAMKFGVPPVGTVAHEWFMGVAAITNDYEAATETALRNWVCTFGEGVLGISLTDTFGTATFLRAFTQPLPKYIAAGGQATRETEAGAQEKPPSYAQVFTGVRQDSGDPLEFVRTMRDFYNREGITDAKTIVFSDSLNVERCLEYRKAAKEAGFQPSFGVGTFFTNDFKRVSNGEKSAPLNIVIKLSSAGGQPAIKISDNAGKNMGDAAKVAEVKRKLGYEEHEWKQGDERQRWKS